MQFVYVPIPENREQQARLRRTFDEFLPSLREFEEQLRIKDDALGFPRDLLGHPAHLDPDFQHLTYGDNGDNRGAKLKTFERGDLVVFYAGLRSVGSHGGLIYALVGLFVVEETVSAEQVPRDRWHQNAHTRVGKIARADVIVRAQKGRSGRLARFIPVGEWRKKAYRVTEEVLDAWGGLSVKDGYIQRSGSPPSFLAPEKFYDWFLRQGVGLVERNN